MKEMRMIVEAKKEKRSENNKTLVSEGEMGTSFKSWIFEVSS